MMKAIDIEIAVANYFGIRQNIIVPNASWGVGLHECDLLIVRPSGYLVEVEIKVSRSDLKKDAEKKHGHESNKIKELWFAVPESLVDACKEYAPARAGILGVDWYERYNGGRSRRAWHKRSPVINRLAKPLNEAERFNTARLAAMRIWGLKEKLAKTYEPTQI